MGKSSPSPPPVPQPAQQIQAQSQANREAVRESAKVSAVDLDTPFGEVTYERDESGVPTKQVTSLTPTAQSTLEAQQQAGLDLTNLAQQRIGEIPTDRFTIENAPYNPRDYSDPLTVDYTPPADAPFDPTSARYQQDSAAMQQGSQKFQDQAAVASLRQNIERARADQAQQFGNRYQQADDRLRDEVTGGPYNPAEYGSLNTYRDDVQQAYFDRNMSLLQPQFDQQTARAEQQLADRGIPVGSAAYRQTMNNLRRQQGEQQARIAQGAVLSAGGEAQRQLGMEQTLNAAARQQAGQLANFSNQSTQGLLAAQNQAAQQRASANTSQFNIQDAANKSQQQDISNRLAFEQALRGGVRSEAMQDAQQQTADRLRRIQAEQQLRGSAIQEDLLQRGQAFNEASALITGAPALGIVQAPATPQFQIAPPDVMGANQLAYNAQANAFNQAQQGRSNMVNAGIGALGSAIGKCHSSYKQDIVDLTDALGTMRALHVKGWRYLPKHGDSQRHVSPMAEDWHELTGLGDGRTIHFGDYLGLLHLAFQQFCNIVLGVKK